MLFYGLVLNFSNQKGRFYGPDALYKKTRTQLHISRIIRKNTEKKFSSSVGYPVYPYISPSISPRWVTLYTHIYHLHQSSVGYPVYPYISPSITPRQRIDDGSPRTTTSLSHRYSENQKTVEYEDDTEEQMSVFDIVTMQRLFQVTYQITF